MSSVACSHSIMSSHKYSVRVLSFNVLFPNSGRVWWVYKYYSTLQLPEEEALRKQVRVPSSWVERRKLLRSILAEIDADIVCLQEPRAGSGVVVHEEKTSRVATEDSELSVRSVGPESQEGALTAQFHEDFAFMTDELGYECELLTKGQIRPATFWKKRPSVVKNHQSNGNSNRFFSIRKVESAHKYRMLISLFELNSSIVTEVVDHQALAEKSNIESTTTCLLAVVNCHLSADCRAASSQRVTSLQDGLKAAHKLLQNSCAELNNNSNVSQSGGHAVIICGDFNEAAGKDSVHEFLVNGQVPDSV